ncbi:AGE family epimerase/isomerase [Brevundimonas diminuta]|uniref:AGE family epimerase/isomerase n=1 Tax=Brevundimonas diminuta TaxID=293 RepID=UPI003F7D873D
MRLYPVIMCGGAGTRLWPASRPSRPKQFIPLSGNRSLFQEAVLRTKLLVSDGGRIIVIGGQAHRSAILDQLHEIGVVAQILLEPEARDSAAAMAAAAAWTEQHDADGVNVFVASDHHIPDHGAFCEAVRTAGEAALKGHIVTLGIKPTEPSTSYGYIQPAASGLSAVKCFVEKPDKDVAQSYMNRGFLWNSGNFIISAKTLIGELSHCAPDVLHSARSSIEGCGGEIFELGPAFRSAPKISIDYALMERTHRAWVLPVDFQWSDLGAWDAVAATGEGEFGGHIFEDAEGCMARAPEGVVVAALGVRNLAIVVEGDAVLVCDLSRAQDVKKVVERLRRSSPQHIDFVQPEAETLESGAHRFREWLRLRALPLWSSVGQAEDGAFAELLNIDGRSVAAQRRAHVQARQIYVFAQAGLLGWQGPWRKSVMGGFEYLERTFLRSDGLMRALVAHDGAPLDEDFRVYDQAFLLLALATAQRAGIDWDGRGAAVAHELRKRLLERGDGNGAIIETGERPYQSNAHMHLLEAALAWFEVSGDPVWSSLAEQIASLAATAFMDSKTGRLREFFEPDWTPALGENGRLIEPGHQFEWAWLLARLHRRGGDQKWLRAARTLFDRGVEGVDARGQVAVDALDEEGSVRIRRARLWPQTEWLKASLLLADLCPSEETRFLSEAARAQRAVWTYLTDDGLWRDKRLESGRFIEEASPASSLYHIVSAFTQVAEARTLGSGAPSLALS